MTRHAARRSPGRALALVLLAALVAALAATPARAASRKLNGPLAPSSRIAAIERLNPLTGLPLRPGYQVSPDNATVVFLGEQSTDGVTELYAASLRDGAPRKLNAPLPPGGNVIEFAIDPNGERVVYLADQRADERFELFSVPLAGGEPVSLNQPLAPGGNVTSFALSPDGGTVVFRADRDADERYDLFSVPLALGAPETRLNPRDSAIGGVPPDFALSADNQRVVFRFDPRQEGRYAIFSAPLTGGAAAADITLGALGAPGGPSAVDFVLSPAGERALYRFSDPATGSLNLAVSTIAGPSFVVQRLTSFGAGSSVARPGPADAPPPPPSADPRPYAFAPNGTEVLFIADATPGRYQLFRVTAVGGPGAPSDPQLVSGIASSASDVVDFQLSPDGERVVFLADLVSDNQYALISVQRDGSTPALIGLPTIDAGDVLDYAISPDGARVVFLADYRTDGVNELLSAPILGQAGPTVLNSALPDGGSVTRFAIAPGSQRVVYSAAQEHAAMTELFSVLIAGGGPVRLNGPLPAGGNVADFALSPLATGTRVIFRADQRANELFDLVATPLGGGPRQTLNVSTAVAGDVTDYAITPDGATVVFLADANVDGGFELWSNALNDPDAPRRLNDDLAPGGSVLAFRLGPDSRRVVYRADQDGDGLAELFSVPTTGGDVTRLNGALAAGGVGAFQLSPDGRSVVFLGAERRGGVVDLYSAAIAGGNAPTRLTSLPAGRAIGAFAFSPDSARVVFLADGRAVGTSELFSVPVAGGAILPLNPPLAPGGNVTAFAIAPTGDRVAYIADQASDEAFELFSVPLLGGPAVRVSAPARPGAGVLSGAQCAGQRGPWELGELAELAPLLVSPDGRFVLYCADHETPGVPELYSAPLAGDAPAVRLNSPPGPGGGVIRFAINPDATSVIVLVRVALAGGPQDQLFSTPIAGGKLPRRLDMPRWDGSTVTQFALTPRGDRIVYRGAQEQPGVSELFSVHLGGGVPVRRSGPLAPGGSVGPFSITARGDRIIFLADRQASGANELFANLVSGPSSPVLLSGSLVPRGAVRSFAVRPRGDLVVYRADQETAGVEELFATPLTAPVVIFAPLMPR